MYHPQIIKERLALAQTQLDQSLKKSEQFSLTRHSIAKCGEAVTHLDSLRNSDGLASRPFTPRELQWIRNERILAKCDLKYYLTRYFYIKSDLGGDGERTILFPPNLPQLMAIDGWAEDELRGVAIADAFLKVRQVGISTLIQGALSQRALFYPNVNGLILSSDPDKTREMAGMILYAIDRLPYWLTPPDLLTYQSGETLLEVPSSDSAITLQHGTQRSGIARGRTPTDCHASEPGEYQNAEEIFDASLMRAMHESPNMFICLEGTGKGIHSWWHRTYEFALTYYPQGMSRFKPRFLAWYLGDGVWPTKNWLKKFPPPKDWQPSSITQLHAKSCAEYAQSDPSYVKYLGSQWEMPKHQKWFYEFDRNEHEQKQILSKFLQEMPSNPQECVVGDSRVSSNLGILQIGSNQFQKVSNVETGEMKAWIPKGRRSTLRLTTQMGRDLQATPEHLVAMADGSWRTMDSLLEGDEIQLSPPIFADDIYTAKWSWMPGVDMSVVIDETWAKLLGYLMGDGCFSSRDTLDVACDAKDSDVVIDVSNTIAAIVGKAPRSLRKGGLIRLSSCNIKWAEVLRGLGCIEQRVSKQGNNGWKRKVHIPECIWRSPKHIVAAFLSALFECDGHARMNAAATLFFSCHEQFVKDIQLLLLGFGITSYWREENKVKPTYTYIGRSLYLPANSSNKFHDEIGFIGARKRAGRRGTGQQSRAILCRGLTDKIKTVEPAGEQDVYDISVAESHCFGANGILVHNCWQSDAGHPIFTPIEITELRQMARQPIAVYAITGTDIPDKFRPHERNIDQSRAILHIGSKWNRHYNEQFALVPIKWRGYQDTGWELLLYVWEQPTDGAYYGVGVDTGDGIGADRTVIQVLKRGALNKPAVQVAEFSSAWISATGIVPWMMAIASWYSVRNPDGERKQARLAIDVTKSDAPQVEARKRGWHTGNFHQWERFDRKRRTTSNAIGWYQVSWARDYLVDYTTTHLKQFWIRANSPWLIEELRDLEKSETRQRIEAMSGAHDDRFFSLGMIHMSLHVWAHIFHNAPIALGGEALQSHLPPTFAAQNRAKSMLPVPPMLKYEEDLEIEMEGKMTPARAKAYENSLAVLDVSEFLDSW